VAATSSHCGHRLETINSEAGRAVLPILSEQDNPSMELCFFPSSFLFGAAGFSHYQR